MKTMCTGSQPQPAGRPRCRLTLSVRSGTSQVRTPPASAQGSPAVGAGGNAGAYVLLRQSRALARA
jgi:hypothetical protein